MLKNAFPVNVLNAVKHCPEVCNIYCATANPVEVIVAETAQGREYWELLTDLHQKHRDRC